MTAITMLNSILTKLTLFWLNCDLVLFDSCLSLLFSWNFLAVLDSIVVSVVTLSFTFCTKVTIM